jgi:hypothetical protein
MDKFSKFSPNMFRLQQAFIEKVKFCSDGPSGRKKNSNLLGPANQTSRKGKFVQINLKKWQFYSQTANHTGMP